MLYSALVTLICFTSPLEREVDRTVEERIFRLAMADPCEGD
jgi:hypothetical protein